MPPPAAACPGLAAALTLALAATASAAPAHPEATLGIPGPPQPSPTSPQLPSYGKAGWSCSREACAYVKVGGSWGNCFTAWAPSHRSWRPTRYCH